MVGSGPLRRVALAVAGAALLALSAGPSAKAADDGYQNVFSSVLGAVGVIQNDPPPEIEYRERPPLVIPPRPALPKPVPGTSRTAAWPQDPDVVRRRKTAQEARAPRPGTSREADGGMPLSKPELLEGRGQEGPVRPNTCGRDGDKCLLLSPDELKAQSDRFRAMNPEKSDTIVAGQEPDREYLTQPPRGYMKPVKTVKATAEAPEAKVDESNPRYMQQMEQRKREEQ